MAEACPQPLRISNNHGFFVRIKQKAQEEAKKNARGRRDGRVPRSNAELAHGRIHQRDRDPPGRRVRVVLWGCGAEHGARNAREAVFLEQLVALQERLKQGIERERT